MRQPAARIKPRLARSKSWPAPRRGWIANDNLAKPGKEGAYLLENWFPTAEAIKMRGGSLLYATIGDGSDDVTAVFSYLTGGVQKLFASTETDIYDISSVADPEVSPSAAVSSLNGGDWSVVQFQTTGGVYIRCVNGEDQSRQYDGSSWSTPTIDSATSSGADISDTFSYIWAWKQRLFFIEKESLNAWYLPVSSVAGTAVKLPLGAIFKRGGTLLFGASWSQDTGSGLDAMNAFFTTEGEVAIYQGTDPSSSTTWALVGVYRIGRPLGKNAWMQAGGDLVIATDVGFVPLSQATQKDFAALGPASVSYPIETAWNERVDRRSFSPWHCEVYPTRQMVVIAMPSNSDNRAEMLVANARTGAWCLFTGWDGTCLEVYRDRLFFGSTEGRVFLADTTGADDGVPYTASCILQPDDLGDPASQKFALECRVAYRSQYEPNEIVFVSANFDDTLPTAPDAPTIDASSIWGDAVWGEDVWASGEIEKDPYGSWRGVSGSGDVLAPGVRVTSGSIVPPRTDLLRLDLLYDKGDVIS